MSVVSPLYRLTDTQWGILEPLLPSSRGRRGGRYKDHRLVIDG
jgi:hypothetical protein